MAAPATDGPVTAGSAPTDRWLSLIAAGLVVAVVAITIGVWAAAPDGPARFTVATAAAPDRLVVEVRNTGGTVATDVVVRATFADGGEADQTLSWLSPGETGRLVFLTPDPAGPVEVDVVSYVADN